MAAFVKLYKNKKSLFFNSLNPVLKGTSVIDPELSCVDAQEQQKLCVSEIKTCVDTTSKVSRGQKYTLSLTF